MWGGGGVRVCGGEGVGLAEEGGRGEGEVREGWGRSDGR